MALSPTAEQVDAAARALAAGIPKGALASALSVGSDRAAAQNQTLGNIRSRTAALLPTSAISVTFATSVGVLANDPSNGGVRMPVPIAVLLLVCVIAIAAVTVIVQWPIKWSFDSGTDVYNVGGADEEPALRAAIAKLENVIAKNTHRLRRTFIWFEIGIVLLGIQTVLIVAGLILANS